MSVPVAIICEVDTPFCFSRLQDSEEISYYLCTGTWGIGLFKLGRSK